MKKLGFLAMGIGLLGLWACTPPPQGLQGNVFTSPSAGGQPVHGARVIAQVGSRKVETTTGLDGHFSLQIPGNAQAFTLTVLPPAGQGVAALTFAEVPLSAYRSPYGAASEMNIYLPAPPSRILPGYPPRTGYLTGTVTLGGQPVASSTPRTLNQLFDPPTPCEDGLVVFGGFRTVTTDTNGQYQIPVVSTNNLYAASGSVWAGNYTGTDTGDCNTATEYYWSHFRYVPDAWVYLNGSSTQQDMALEAFDPQANPSRVTTLQVTHDLSGLSQYNPDPTSPGWNAFSVSVPTFNHAIHSDEVELGQYYYFGQASKTLRVYKLPPGASAQQIAVTSIAIRFRIVDNTLEVLDLSQAQNWRDGTNLANPLTVHFLDTPKLGIEDGTTLGATPTLTWNPVAGAKVYVVSVYDEGGNLVWAGFTPNTSLVVPFPLATGASYFWDVYTDDQTEMLDYIGMDPAALQARLYLDTKHLVRLKSLRTNPVNRQRGELAKAYLDNLGYIPQGAYQKLLQNGYRKSVSEIRSFTVQ
ncbi:hypothetical protein KQ693_03950 [Thermus sp. PS18]|uniref:hypothetical protein n=1 Tax=Thermus sp. PS18 TaxID=2849039 RepID=UPI00226408E3|nr:hypothetical protein [Thermus sp. PS18]UZX16192.1 hypothetical protein KQ693_03950 [Thermus sp. PS18]